MSILHAASEPRRPRALVLAHWLTALILALAAGLILVRESAEGRALRTLLLNLHRNAGLLAAVAQGALPARLAASAVHLLLYLLLLALPLVGWALSNAHGHDVSLFGLVQLPALVEEDEDLGDLLEDAHFWGACALGGLVLLHAGAALWHHWVLKDEVLRAMSPRSPRSRA
ncbi:MAG: cytochrome b/b6 domain-containing protein [Rhodocyclales bacterium]|nr:cytochrome b/b6 domain-containing protein [Rhodocyclales bacterium]